MSFFGLLIGQNELCEVNLHWLFYIVRPLIDWNDLKKELKWYILVICSPVCYFCGAATHNYDAVLVLIDHLINIM